MYFLKLCDVEHLKWFCVSERGGFTSSHVDWRVAKSPKNQHPKWTSELKWAVAGCYLLKLGRSSYLQLLYETLWVPFFNIYVEADLLNSKTLIESRREELQSFWLTTSNLFHFDLPLFIWRSHTFRCSFPSKHLKQTFQHARGRCERGGDDGSSRGIGCDEVFTELLGCASDLVSGQQECSSCLKIPKICTNYFFDYYPAYWCNHPSEFLEHSRRHFPRRMIAVESNCAAAVASFQGQTKAICCHWKWQMPLWSW